MHEGLLSNISLTVLDVEEWMGKKGVEQFSLDELMHFLRESTSMRGKEDLVNDAVQEFGLKERKSAAASSSDACITPEDMKLFMVKYLQPKVKGLLGVEQIASHSDLCFIPKDKHFPTRHVGSWVCVCTGAALMMVRDTFLFIWLDFFLLLLLLLLRLAHFGLMPHRSTHGHRRSWGWRCPTTATSPSPPSN